MSHNSISVKPRDNSVMEQCQVGGLKGKTMERGGGPKHSYTGGKIRGTKGELLLNKS